MSVLGTELFACLSMNHMKPIKDPKNKTKCDRNLPVVQKSFSIFSLVCKSKCINCL